MIISDPVIKPYEIHVEKNSFTVGKIKKTKKGDEFSAEKWFLHLNTALEFIAKSQLVNEDQVVTLGEFIKSHTNKIQQFKNTISL